MINAQIILLCTYSLVASIALDACHVAAFLNPIWKEGCLTIDVLCTR